MTPSDRASLVAQIAMGWEAARREVIRLKTERNGHRCENEEDGDYETNAPAIPPCWKHQDLDYTGQPFPEDDWCEPCFKRQAIHTQVKLATRKRAALLRRLQVHAHRLSQELVTA